MLVCIMPHDNDTLSSVPLTPAGSVSGAPTTDLQDALIQYRDAVAWARENSTRLEDEIAILHRRLAAAEQRAEASAAQLRNLTQPHLLAARDRLRLAVALDEPDTLYSAEAVTAEIQRLRQDAVEARRRMQQREAELLSSTSWRVTAPLRAFAKLMRV